MKWEQVKQQVAATVSSRVREGHGFEGKMLSDLVLSDFAVLRQLKESEKWHGPIRDAYADQVYTCIVNWDIRAAERLRDLFPSEFPVSLRKAPLRAEHDAKGNWALVTS